MTENNHNKCINMLHNVGYKLTHQQYCLKQLLECCYSTMYSKWYAIL